MKVYIDTTTPDTGRELLRDVHTLIVGRVARLRPEDPARPALFAVLTPVADALGRDRPPALEKVREPDSDLLERIEALWSRWGAELMAAPERDPGRIDGALAVLAAAWRAHPDLRLGQLVVNAAGDADSFYVEDDVLAAALARLADEGGV